MVFNFKLLFQLLYKALFAARGTDARLTPRRAAVMLIMFPLYVAIEAANWLGFMLDEIFFPGYHHQEIRQPVFIVGVPRSGTTFLHRLLAKDAERFTSMRFWEIMFAPSIVQKKIFIRLGAVDKLFGNPLARLVVAFESRSLKTLSAIHRIGFFEAEEDSMLLFHNFSSALLAFMFPFAEDIWPYVCPDLEMDVKQRARIMNFYKKCVQRHVFVFGRGKQFLSKNPVFSAMVQSLNATFPDAQFVCMVRSPLEAVPSAISLFCYYFHKFLSPLEQFPMRDAITRMIAVYYRHPLEKMGKLSPGRQQILSYTALTANPGQTIIDLYERFGLSMTPAYRQILGKEAEKARSYKSGHAYSLEQFGLTREQLLEEYRDIFDLFGFEK